MAAVNAIAHEAEREHEVRVDALGERLAALRLCDGEALASVQRSLSQHGQLAAATVYVAERGQLEVIDGFKRLRAARALGWSTLRVHELGVDGVGAKVAIDTLHHPDRAGLLVPARLQPPQSPRRLCPL
jgi:hypothetical protein